MSRTTEVFDVVIIGSGPSGATLAHLLGIYGLSVLVLDREGGPHQLPRAVHFDDEVMRVFQTIGLSDAIAREIIVNPGMRFVDPDGKLLLDWSRPQEIGPHGWHASYRFHQPDLDRLLNETLAQRPTVHVARRCEAFYVEDRGDRVTVRYEEMSTGRLVEVEAAHAVGCDGARSLVRRFIGSEMTDCGFHERWLVVDVELQSPKPALGSHSIQHCHPQRSITYTRQPGDRRRWEIKLLAGEHEQGPPAPDEIWPLLARWIAPGEARFERIAIYTFHSLIAKRWRNGRLWIAGDAAHQTPPFMGQGMCAGIRDVANLAWKLVMAIKGGVGEALLDSYQSERQPNVANYIDTAIRLGGLINSTDPEGALTLARPAGEGAFRMESVVSRLGTGLGTGPLKGALFPQPLLQTGSRMDDHVGYAPVLVADADIVQGLDIPEGLNVLVAAGEPVIADELARLGVRAAILRPDRYILATADDARELASQLSEPLVREMASVFRSLA